MTWKFPTFLNELTKMMIFLNSLGTRKKTFCPRSPWMFLGTEKVGASVVHAKPDWAVHAR